MLLLLEGGADGVRLDEAKARVATATSGGFPERQRGTAGGGVDRGEMQRMAEKTPCCTKKNGEGLRGCARE